MHQQPEPVPPEVEAAVEAALTDLPRDQAAYRLAAIANRAAAALHKLARETADSRRGTPEWGRWARLQNASRDAVLRTATSRQVAREIRDQEAGPSPT